MQPPVAYLSGSSIPPFPSPDEEGLEEGEGGQGYGGGTATAGHVHPPRALWTRGEQPQLVRHCYQVQGQWAEALQRWERREPGILLVTGDYGSGKSHLLDYLAQCLGDLPASPPPLAQAADGEGPAVSNGVRW